MRTPVHSERRARIRQIRALKERLFAAVAANRPPELIDIVRGTSFCALVEAGLEAVEGTMLNSLYLQVDTLLPAAEALYDRFYPSQTATADAAGAIVIDQEGDIASTKKET